MNYENRGGIGITAIDELPDLEDLENNNRPAPMIPMIHERPNQLNREQYQKYIRTNAPTNMRSGMSAQAPPQMMSNLEGYGPPQPGMQHATLQPVEQYAGPSEPRSPPPPVNVAQPDPLNISCIDISKHIQGCPICSKFYNNDRTVYVIALVVLSIVCLLLLKRVLNV